MSYRDKCTVYLKDEVSAQNTVFLKIHEAIGPLDFYIKCVYSLVTKVWKP